MYTDIGYITSNLSNILHETDPFVTDESFSNWLANIISEIEEFNPTATTSINGHIYKIRLIPKAKANRGQLECVIYIDGGEDFVELDLSDQKVQGIILDACKDLVKKLNEHLAKIGVAYITTAPCLWFEGSYYVKLESVHSGVQTEFVQVKFNENPDDSTLYTGLMPNSTI